MHSQMASRPPFEPPADRPAVLSDAIEAWSVFEQFFVLSYRSAPGIPVLINDLSLRSSTILGISPDSILNDAELFERLLHPDDRDRVLVEHWDAAASGEPFVSEYRMVSEDGTVLWIYDKAVPVTDSVGRDHAVWELPRHHTRQGRGAPQRHRGSSGLGFRRDPGRRVPLLVRAELGPSSS